MPATAVFVLSYALADDRTTRGPHPRLTSQTTQSVLKAIQIMRAGKASLLILSTCYDTWKSEAQLKYELLEEHGINLDNVEVIPSVTSTIDEIAAVKQLVEAYGITKIILVADKWHAKRAFEIFKEYYHGLEVEPEEFTTPRYERTKEPLWIKSVRASNVILWALWHAILHWRDQRRRASKQTET